MSPTSASPYTEDLAAVYDEWFSGWLDTADTGDRLAALAGAGPALELGIGTGRVAIPLAERGVELHGIEGSQSMLARLRARAGGVGRALPHL